MINENEDLFLAGDKSGRDYIQEKVVMEIIKLKVKDKVTIIGGEYKGKEGIVKDLEGDEVLVKIAGKPKFIAIKNIEKL